MFAAKKVLAGLSATLLLGVSFTPQSPAEAAPPLPNRDHIATIAPNATTELPLPLPSPFDWRKYGWELVLELGKWIEAQIPHDGSTIINDEMVYLISPGINYNRDNTGSEFYFRPFVDAASGSARMHGHRTFPLDVYAKMTLILSRPDGTTAATLTSHSNQYLFYNFSDDFLRSNQHAGNWKAQYITQSNTTWQNYYWMNYLIPIPVSLRTPATDTPPNVSYSPQGRAFFYSSSQDIDEEVHITAKRGKQLRVLTFGELNDQFKDDTGQIVDNLRDYTVGDKVLVSGEIKDMRYNPLNDRTTLTFESVSLEGAPQRFDWTFSGDLQSQFSVGNELTFLFRVVNIGSDANRTFEGLDFFEDVFELSMKEEVPNIGSYLPSPSDLVNEGGIY